MKKIIVILFFVFYCGLNFAQESLTLQQAIEIGLKNNYSIIISKNQSIAAINNVSLGNAGALPQLNLNLSQTNSVNDINQKYATGAEVNKTNAKSDALTASAAVTWTVFDGFQMFASYNKLKELESLGELNARLTVENSVSQIISAYYDIVKQKALLSVIDSSRKISEIKLNIAKTKFNIGLASKTEFLQAQLDLNADLSASKKQLITIDAAKIYLNQLLAREVTLDVNVNDSIEINFSQPYEELKSKTKAENSSLLMSERDMHISSYVIKELQAQRFPKLDLTGSYNYTKSSSQANLILENRSDGFNYGFTVTYNLFNGLNLNRNIKNAKLDYENSKINLAAAQINVNADLEIAYRNFQNNKDLLNLERANSDLAKENVSLSLERFRVGTTNELQLKDAQQSFVEAMSRLVSAQYDTKIAESVLKKISGQLLK